MKLRPYQEEAKAAILREWNEGRQKTLLVLPTGCGKTIVFAKVVEECVRQGKRVLILAHRGELLQQAADKLSKASGLNCAVEKAESTAAGSFFRVTVGSIQSLMRESRLKRFRPDHYDTIIVDEAHHVLSDSYQKVLNYFGGANVLGVTATPDRGDMKNLGTYFDSLAYEYTLPKAIKEGYLSPIRVQTIPLNIDLSTVKVSAGDFSVGDVGSALDPYLERIAEEMKAVASDRKIIVFTPLIATSVKFVKMLNERGFKAVEVNGNSKDRAQILEDFENNKYNIIVNSMLLNEGFDCPSIDCVVVLRPTKVRSLFSQMVGRGTRLFQGKDHLLLLDFLWHVERHELARPACLISENEEVSKRITKIIEESDGSMDLEEVEEQAKEDVMLEREAALAEQLKAMRTRKRKLVDPLQYEMSIDAEDLANYVPAFGWQMSPPSQEQVSALERHGIFPDDIENAGKASMILDRLAKRRDEGLTTPKQIRFLEAKGFHHVGTWPFDKAKSLIDQIAGNGWRIPRHINPSTYNPNVAVR